MLNDYPKFGVWPGRLLPRDQPIRRGRPAVWAGQGVMAFERDKMLQGLPAQTVYFDLFGVNANYGGAIPSDLDGPVLPPQGALNVFVEMDDDSFGWTPIDRLALEVSTWTGRRLRIRRSASRAIRIEVIDLRAAGLAFDSNLCGYSQPAASPARNDESRIDACPTG